VSAARELLAEAEQHEALASATEQAMLSGAVVADDDSIAGIDAARVRGRAARFKAQVAERHAERGAEAARQAGLKQLHADIEAFAAGSTVTADIEEALALVRASRDRIETIAREHNSAVAALDARAISLGVGAMPPGGPSAGDGGIGRAGGGLAAGGVQVMPFGNVAAVAHMAVAAANPLERVDPVPVMVSGRTPASRPPYLIYNLRGGALLAVDKIGSGELDAMRKGELLILPGHAVDAWMAGTLTLTPEVLAEARQGTASALAARAAAERKAADAAAKAAHASMAGAYPPAGGAAYFGKVSGP